MAKRKRSWNKAKYDRYLHAGRGQGERAEYLPWITVQDFSSKGIVSRVYSYKTNRIHHFLSRNELNFFYLLEWSEKALDIREQFPLLDVKRAIDIASSVGIRYPKDNISGYPYIMTCDFMITTDEGFKARTIKSSTELNNIRTLEKLEIERRYWDSLGIDWHIVTENEIDFQKAKHVEWLYTAAKLPKYLADQRYLDIMMEKVSKVSIQNAANWFDEQFGYSVGSGLLIIKHLMWHKHIQFQGFNRTNTYKQAMIGNDWGLYDFCEQHINAF